MRQPLFVRRNGELAAAGLAKVKTAAAWECKNFACDLAADFLNLSQHLLQFGRVKDHSSDNGVYREGQADQGAPMIIFITIAGNLLGLVVVLGAFFWAYRRLTKR
jgi:hypothetical protein